MKPTRWRLSEIKDAAYIVWSEAIRVATMSEQCVWRFDQRIVSDAATARQILNDVLAHLEAEHWVQNDIFAIHLAMEEALVNAIHHGNQLDAKKHIHVVCTLSSDRIRIEIGDEGDGFDPAHLPDPTCYDHLETPCGRGVMLMKAFMSHVEFNANGNRVVLEKVKT